MILEPPLKWPGGKRWLAGLLSNMYGPHKGFRRLVEPFVGGMSIVLACRPRDALLNDANDDLINFYRHLLIGLEPQEHIARFENAEAVYYDHRTRFNRIRQNGQGGSAEAAALFYYLNRTGWHGLVRYNGNGNYNVPFGHYQQPVLLGSLLSYSTELKQWWWEFTCGDFADVELEPDDFVYADPPYHGAFDGYTVEGFSWEDQERLAHWLTEHPGPVVASNNATPQIVELYRGLGFSLQFLDGRGASIANYSPTRPREMLATRGMVLPQPRLF